MIETWHPFAVHVPITLVMLWPLFDLLGLVFKRPDLSLAGLLILVASVPATLFATVTGQAAYDAAIANGSAPALLATHVDRGEVMPWVMLLLLLLRFAGPRKWGRRAQLASVGLGVLVMALVISVGYSGGQLVYENGVGVRLYREKAPR
jgi:uncharacterized membrane protein